MATAIDRILDLLPHTFRARPRPTALHSLADAFGGELLSAGNALAEVLRAHWVDHADRGETEILDLALLAALYGLKPREAPFPEESVDEFRDHLKRYVRTFLDGTSTVRGVLRVTAETLGLRIDDDEAHIDAWWRRADDSVTAVRPLLDDAARAVLGFARAEAAGTDSTPATLVGPVLPAAIDLRGHSTLVLSADAGGETEIDLAAAVADLSRATLAEVVAAIEAALPGVASAGDGRLVLRSPTAGAAGRLEVHDHPADAAPVLLGLAPRGYRGRPEATARIVGAHDLSLGVELGGARYLRGVVDRATTMEPDLDPARTGTVALQDVIDAINHEVPHLAAEADGRLVLASRAPGAAGSLAVQAPAAHDAAGVLLGPAARVAVGRDPSPALLRGLADLSDGLSLAPGMRLRVEVDGGPAVDVDLSALAGPEVDPNAVAQLLSAALAPAACAFDGRFLRLVSAERGTAGTIVLPPLPADEDAAGPLFGVGARVFRGTDATPARLEATVELEGETDLGAAYRLAVAVDGGAPVTVDLRAGAADAHHVTRAELRDAVNSALGAGVASLQGRRLALASPTEGSASKLEVFAREETVRRRFVTRAAVADDAATAILGFQLADARGTPPGLARIVGTPDLSRGADLSHGRFLRIAVDGAPPRDVDCTGAAPGIRRVPRPRAALLGQVVAAINDAFADLATESYPGPASDDGVHLVLTSPTPGGDGSIVLAEPRGQDALDAVLGLEPDTYRGRDATRVTFTGAADLSSGVDLTAAQLVSVGVDGDPVEVACAGADPAHTAPAEIAGAINRALGKFVAHTDGRRIILVSPTTGATSRIVFAVPSGPDATRAVFGVSAPREYFGPPAQPARLDGLRDLSAGADLRVARHLRLSIDGAPPADVDVAATAADPAHATAEEVKDAINQQVHFDLARVDGGHLVLETASRGSGSRITLLPFSTGDARAALLGDAPSEARGADAAPARVGGTAKVDGKPKMLGPADLSLGATLRVAVDGGRPVDVRVAGEDPAATTLAEAVAAINLRLPGLAGISDDFQLLLTSPTRGPASRVQVLPARVIELAEYPPEPAAGVHCSVVHGGGVCPDAGGVLRIDNDGAAEADAEIELVSPGGAAGPGFVDLATGNRVRLLHAVEAGRRVRIRRGPAGGIVTVLLDDEGGEGETIPASEVLAGPAGPHELVPFRGPRAIGPIPGGAETLVLNDPAAAAVVVLRPVGGSAQTVVEVAGAQVPAAAPLQPGDDGEVRMVARLRDDGGRWLLADGAGARIAVLRPGPGVQPHPLSGRAVVAQGRLFGTGDAAMLLATSLHAAFDVSAHRAATETEPAAHERWEAVTIGGGGDDGLAAAMEDGAHRSRLLRAAETDKGALLVLPRGRSRWMYVECAGPRFGHARFDGDRFPGAACPEAGIFGISRFPRRTDVEQPVFAPWGDNPAAEVSVRWSTHLPGAFEVHLPADLPDWFGGRFNDARFGSGADAPERFDVVTEPRDDPEFVVDAVNLGSRVVGAREVSRVPIGWTGVPVPFRRPRVRRLRRGLGGEPARLYLTDPAVPLVVELHAVAPGEWGNGIEVSVRPNGPGRFELTVHYGGGRFECARAVVRGGGRLPPLGADLTAPGPLGLLHARAAGVAFRVAREGAWTPAPEPFTPPKGTPA